MSDPDTPAGAADAVCRPLRADAQRNRDRILTAAAAVFAAEGAGAQMDAIAARAEVGVGTVYRHFPTKEALLGEMVRRKFALMVDCARAAQKQAGEPFEVFADLLRANAETMAADAATQDALQNQGREVWDAAEAEKAELMALVEPLIERAKRAGTLRADFSRWDIPVLMGGVCATMGSSGPPGGDWRRHLEIVLDGLRARPS
ncbi:MAG: TetR/AcrR family transcriptional regulator [Actinomycetota bacterium]|nr:TetR/AcrR family transcriptional regulator [Actinomycetota bacterium]